MVSSLWLTVSPSEYCSIPMVMLSPTRYVPAMDFSGEVCITLASPSYSMGPW
jgi:hypothetical protein